MDGPLLTPDGQEQLAPDGNGGFVYSKYELGDTGTEFIFPGNQLIHIMGS